MEARIRLMELLLSSGEVRIREEVRVEYSRLLRELRRGIIQELERQMLELKNAMEVRLGEIAANHPCCNWCVNP
jgi:hypothetical protein